MSDPELGGGLDAERELSEWRAVLEQMPSGVLLARAPDALIDFANDAAREMLADPSLGLGGPPDCASWQGRHLDGTPYAADEWPLLRTLGKGETVEAEEIELQRPDGSSIFVSVTSSPIRDASGEILAAAVILTDVTQRRREHAGRRFLAMSGAVLSSSLDCDVTLENLGTLVVPRIADWCIIDVARDGGLRQVVSRHRDPESAEIAARILESHPRRGTVPGADGEAPHPGSPKLVKAADAGSLELVSRGPAHHALLSELDWGAALVVPLQARGRVVGGITLLATKGSRDFDQEDLALAEELATLAALAIDNARVYDESRTASQAKSDFLSVISHELRTPLTAVIGYSELLGLGIPDPLTERQGEQVGRIEIAAKHLLHLIEEILTVASLEAGTISIRRERVDLSEVLARAVAIAESLAIEKGLALDVRGAQGEIPVDTDPDRLLQIFLNLLSNAVKFTDSGAIVISAGRAGDFAEVSVQDSGIGITPAERTMIFEPFWQAEQPITRRVGGTGLGLTISRRLLDLLGGEIEVVSEPGQGSTFTARVPLWR